MFRWELEATRNTGFYMLKVFLPLTLIVMMSWAVFWIHPSATAPQISVSATSMLTLIAYLFALTGLLPRVSYLTRADYFVVDSMLLVFLGFVEALVTTSLAVRDRTELALRIDGCCRWAFPLAFASVVVVVRFR